MTDEPLIYTSKGNLPIASLKLEAHWDIQPSYVKLIERYLDETGEVVRESAHVYHFMGLNGQGEIGQLGG